LGDSFWIALVLVAAVGHASWNALVKSAEDPTIAFAFVISTGGFLGAVIAPFVGLPPRETWPLLAATTVIHCAYYAMLLAGYARGDLTHVYPIARGLAPVLAGAASGLAGESLSAVEWTGLGLVTMGLALLALPRAGGAAHPWRATLLAAGTGVLIAGYTLVDALGSRQGGGIVYIAWLHITTAVPFLGWILVARREALLRSSRTARMRGLLGGLLGCGGYAIALLAMRVGKVAHVAALRETSVLFAALLGAWLLRERVGPRRFAAAALVAGGLIVMHSFG
jgi:drug/metabolite transporter (DMT)-like permease